MSSNKDMVMLRGGKMFLLIGGELLPMQENVVTVEGALITTDGTIIARDGTTSRLAEDEALIIDLELTRKLTEL